MTNKTWKLQKENITVIVPVHNAMYWLDKCVVSLINQTWEKLEILLLEYDSTDESAVLCDTYVDQYDNVFTEHFQKTSMQTVLNTGLCMAAGEYIQFVFPNVILKSDMCEKMIIRQKRTQAQLSVCSFEELSWNQIEEHKTNDAELLTQQCSGWLLNCAEDMLATELWNKLYRTDIIQINTLSFSEEIEEGMQFAFNLSYMQYCQKICIIGACLCRFAYEIAEEKLNTAFDSRVKDKIAVFRKYCDYFVATESFEKNEQIINRYLLDYIVYECSYILHKEKKKRSKLCYLLQQCMPRITVARSISRAYIIKGCLKYELSPKRRLKNIKISLKSWKLRFGKYSEKIQKEYFDMLRKSVHILCRKLHRKKHILLYCESTTMESHIKDYYDCLKECPEYKFYLFYEEADKLKTDNGIVIVKRKTTVLHKAWDMVVCADVNIPFHFTKEQTKLLYINHGLHMISYDNGESLYAYAAGNGLNEDGTAKFTMMLEPNSRYTQMLSKNGELNGVVKYVGYKLAERIMNGKGQKQAYRKKLGIPNDVIVVALFGTWNRDSLFHKVGKTIIPQCEELQGDKYQFILSIHPREYTRYSEDIEPLGFYIDSLSQKGFIVRQPSEELLPYLIATDVVICDYSSLCEEAMLAGKRIILSDFPVKRVWKQSSIAKFMMDAQVFKETSNLKKMLQIALGESDYQRKYEQYAKEIMPPEEGYQKNVQLITKQLLGEFQ
ncbi:MAG: glycosyltransferase [Lachnospiraceae bacterium]|nr:glycosyltransferase [Lachnospiraceae bacterium]